RRALGIALEAPVVLAAEVPPGEEGLVLDVFLAARAAHPGLLLLFEPRERGGLPGVLGALRARGLSFRLIGERAADAQGDVVVMDASGEAPRWARIASVVLAGGSFSGAGARPSVVAAALEGVPVVLGPSRPESGPLRHLALARAALDASAADLAGAIALLLGS